jgi:hypothetical protein
MKNTKPTTLENIVINKDIAKYTKAGNTLFINSTQEKMNEILLKSKETLEQIMKPSNT